MCAALISASAVCCDLIYMYTAIISERLVSGSSVVWSEPSCVGDVRSCCSNQILCRLELVSEQKAECLRVPYLGTINRHIKAGELNPSMMSSPADAVRGV